MTNNFQLEEIKRFANLLSEHKIRDYVILIGSWATYFYHLFWPSYQPVIRTTDLDFYTGFNRSSYTVDLTTILKTNDYRIDVKQGSDKQFIFNTSGFEIEFVTHLRREQTSIFLVKNLNIYAVPLAYHESINLEQTFIYEFNDQVTIRIIRPSLYIILKLLINRSRRLAKREKDIESIRSILPFLLNDANELTHFLKTIETLNNKQKRICFRTIQQHALAELNEFFTISSL